MADPTTVAGLAYRWRADSVSGTTGTAVSSWPALAGGAALSQGTAANQPTLQLAALGGQSAVRFDGVNDFMTATVAGHAQPVTYAFVMKWNSVSALQELLEVAGIQLVITPGQWDAFAGSDIAGGTVSTSAPVVVVFEANGASSGVWVNGTQVASGNIGTGAQGTVFNLGRHTSLGRYASADVAEVLVYTQALSATDRSTVDTYVQDRYGIAVSDYVSSAPPPPPPSTSSAFANVLDYGAKGDGVTDDHAAFVAAMASGAGRVLVPNRSYMLRSTLAIPAGVVLEGASKYATALIHGFNGDLLTMASYSQLKQFTLVGNGGSYTGNGVTIGGSDGQMAIEDVNIASFDGPCIFFGVNAGSEFRGLRIDAYRTNALTGTGRYAVVVESAFQNSAVPRSFLQLETQGTCGIDFGGCNDMYVGHSTIGDLRFTDNTRGLNIGQCRWLNQGSVTIFGHGITIVGCDILPNITIDASANAISIGPNSYNRLPIVNNGATSVNIITYSA